MKEIISPAGKAKPFRTVRRQSLRRLSMACFADGVPLLFVQSIVGQRLSDYIPYGSSCKRRGVLPQLKQLAS
jgi:hypothetical protein